MNPVLAVLELFLLAQLFSFALVGATTASPTANPTLPQCATWPGMTKKLCDEAISAGCNLKWFGKGCTNPHTGKHYNDGGCQRADTCTFHCKSKCDAQSQYCCWQGKIPGQTFPTIGCVNGANCVTGTPTSFPTTLSPTTTSPTPPTIPTSHPTIRPSSRSPTPPTFHFG